MRHHSAICWKEIGFDTGHRVHQHNSKCKNLHGHRYRVVVGVVGEVQTTPGQSSQGMVIDFGDLKKCLQMVHDEFDHKLVLCRADPLTTQLRGNGYLDPRSLVLVDWIPTAENFAIYIFDFLHDHLLGDMVYEVQVWETPTSMASYAGFFSEEEEDATAPT